MNNTYRVICQALDGEWIGSASLYAGASAAGLALSRFRIPAEAAASTLPGRRPPARLGVPARAQVAAVIDGAAGVAEEGWVGEWR